MKLTFLVLSILAIPLIPAFGQGPTEYTPPMAERELKAYILDDHHHVLWVDNYEALLMPCEFAVANADSLFTVKLFDRKWFALPDYVKAGLLYLIPEGEDLDNWNELIAIFRVDTKTTSPAYFHQDLMRIREKNCPGKTYYANVIDEAKNHLTYETKSEQCGDFKAQSEIKKILTPPRLGAFFQFTVWVVEYTKRDGDFTESQRIVVQNWLEAVRLAKGKEIKPFTKNKLYTAF